jgi:hypothetical protein
VRDGYRAAEFYTFPREWIQDHHRVTKSGWQKVHTKGEALDDFKDERGFERIARDLGIDYPK